MLSFVLCHAIASAVDTSIPKARTCDLDKRSGAVNFRRQVFQDYSEHTKHEISNRKPLPLHTQYFKVF